MTNFFSKQKLKQKMDKTTLAMSYSVLYTFSNSEKNYQIFVSAMDNLANFKKGCAPI